MGFIDHKEISEGMLLEFGFAKALNKKTVLLISKDYSFPTLEVISEQVIRFKNIEALNKKLLKIKI